MIIDHFAALSRQALICFVGHCGWKTTTWSSCNSFCCNTAQIYTFLMSLIVF